MKYLFLFVLLFAGIANAQQVSLFDQSGEAVAYIDYDEDSAIFLWDGSPVAFLEKDGEDWCVFGFNKLFLGWFENGFLYDKKGHIAAATEKTINRITKAGRIKGIQKITPFKPITRITPVKPIFRNSWGANSGSSYLVTGKK